MSHLLRRTAGRSGRRAWPIHAYVGANGGGKSLAMIWDTLPSLEAGRPVLSTVRLLDYERPRECEGCYEPDHEMWRLMPLRRPDEVPVDEWVRMPVEDRTELRYMGIHPAAHPLYRPFTSWDQLMNAERCDVLMDEVTGVASSRESMGLPAPVANKLVQLRRADVVVRWSTPAWMRADKIIRECTQAVTHCEGFFSKAVVDVEGDRLWRNRRLFRWKTYDASAFEDFTSGKREEMSSEVRSWHWGPGSPAFAAYDTYDAVLSIGTVSDAGTCYRCGGRRARPACNCEAGHGVTGAGSPTRKGASPEGAPVAPGSLQQGNRRRLALNSDGTGDSERPDTAVLPVLDAPIV